MRKLDAVHGPANSTMDNAIHDPWAAGGYFDQHEAWAALVDPPALHDVLEEIRCSRDYICGSSAFPNGGDFVL